MLGTHYNADGTKHTLHSGDINKAVKQAVGALQLQKQGITAKLVGSHSLQAGGAMAAKLNGVDRDTIKKMGRWSSDTFLMCMHEQIAHLSAGVSKCMTQRVPFRNIANLHVIPADDEDDANDD